VLPSFAAIDATRTRVLEVRGAFPGLHAAQSPTIELGFEPPIPASAVAVRAWPNEQVLTVRLRASTRAWPVLRGAPNATLSVTSITVNNGDACLPPESAVPVAVVLATPSVARREAEMYASTDRFFIDGTGFRAGATAVSLGVPPLVENVDYALDVVSPTRLAVNLLRSTGWPVGMLSVTGVDVGAGEVPVRDGSGAGKKNAVTVAYVVAAPTITSDYENEIFAHDTRQLIVRGTGFDASGTALALDPAPPGGTKVVECTATKLVLEPLSSGSSSSEAGASWVPAAVLPPNDGVPGHAVQGVPLRVVQIKTAIGDVRFDGFAAPVVAVVIDEPHAPADDDDESSSETPPIAAADDDDQPSPAPPPPQSGCDNTCVYARDGYCDDGRHNMPAYCPSGTDCQDCGPVGADNFTRHEGWDDDDVWDDDEVWDDDDWGAAGVDADDDRSTDFPSDEFDLARDDYWGADDALQGRWDDDDAPDVVVVETDVAVQAAAASPRDDGAEEKWLVVAIICVCAVTVLLTLFGFCFFFSTRSGVATTVGVEKTPTLGVPTSLATPIRKLLF